MFGWKNKNEVPAPSEIEQVSGSLADLKELRHQLTEGHAGGGYRDGWDAVSANKLKEYDAAIAELEKRLQELKGQEPGEQQAEEQQDKAA